MHKIHDNLFIGPQTDYDQNVANQPSWWVVHASKEPYHRVAVGYSGPDTVPGHPEYLFARRGQRLMLNLIDAPFDVDIPRIIYDIALEFIHDALSLGNQVLVHCEQGVSRSASIGLLYLRRYTRRFAKEDFDAALEAYSAIYPPFSPGKAIRYFLKTHWEAYAPTL